MIEGQKAGLADAEIAGPRSHGEGEAVSARLIRRRFLFDFVRFSGSRSVGDGCVTPGDILDHRERLLSDPHVDPDFNQLTDARKQTALAVWDEEANDPGGLPCACR